MFADAHCSNTLQSNSDAYSRLHDLIAKYQIFIHHFRLLTTSTADIMSSTPPEASSCYFTETARSLRAALDAKPDTNDISSEPHPSADPHIDIASAANNADTFIKAEKTPTMPSASITNASVLKTSQGNPSNSDDTDIVYHPKLQGVIGIPDLNFTMSLQGK